MPFITEELYQALKDRNSTDSIMISQMPMNKGFDIDFICRFEAVKELISAIRTVRLEKNIPIKEALELQVIKAEYENNFNSLVIKMCNLSSINNVTEKKANAVSFLIGTVEYAIPLGSLLNTEEEIKKMEEEISYLQGFLKSVIAKLSNDRFISNAKPEIVENERNKKADAESKIKSLQESIINFKKVKQ